MKAEDLMIGNWVSDGYGWFRVSKHDLFSKNYAEQLEPISLTEENIVELLGFDNYSSISISLLKRGRVNIVMEKKVLYYKECKIPLPKYVHELQQLIKSLEE